MVAYETIHMMKNKRHGRHGDVALKIDISKAYDRIDWNYLKDILIRFGFSSTWVDWMMLCVKSITYAFIVNGDLVSPISLGRGLRQGDPLSPYLFILYVEGLSAAIDKANKMGFLHGVKICRNAPAVTHLLFVDDCLLFWRGT